VIPETWREHVHQQSACDRCDGVSGCEPDELEHRPMTAQDREELAPNDVYPNGFDQNKQEEQEEGCATPAGSLLDWDGD
jgi:hypothetical protein